MPATVQIADDDVHNHPGSVTIPDADVHNHPVASADPNDPTPVVSDTQVNPSDVPEFEQPLAQQVQLTPGTDKQAIAYSDPNSTTDIQVSHPEDYTSAVQAHELVHMAQKKTDASSSLSKVGQFQDFINQKDESTDAAVSKQSKPDADDFEATYGYNGTEGLAKIMKSPKGISQLNPEQQASIPQNYMKEYTKATKAGDAKAVDRLNEVYGPAIKQLRNMANPSKDTIDTRPDAPGPPAASLTGEAVPVKGMNSNSTKAFHIPTQAPTKASWRNAARSLGGGK